MASDESCTPTHRNESVTDGHLGLVVWMALMWHFVAHVYMVLPAPRGSKHPSTGLRGGWRQSIDLWQVMRCGRVVIRLHLHRTEPAEAGREKFAMGDGLT